MSGFADPLRNVRKSDVTFQTCAGHRYTEYKNPWFNLRNEIPFDRNWGREMRVVHPEQPDLVEMWQKLPHYSAAEQWETDYRFLPYRDAKHVEPSTTGSYH